MAQPGKSAAPGSGEPAAGKELAARAAEWTFELVSMPSVNGTAGEAAFARTLRDRLAVLPFFAADPDAVWLIPLPGDPLGRACVAALLRGQGARTIILTGHFDTVHVEDYGELSVLATRPRELREALRTRLAASAATPAEQLALADLESGDFLPGRGMLDMKSGLGAGLAALEAFAGAADRPGNVLFLAVPDEEANSAGARCAAAGLPKIARRFGLSFDAAINLDSQVDDGDGDGGSGRSVALNTVGKLLPSALVVGQAVHAANSLRGLNAGALAAEIAVGMEWSHALTDRTGDELAAAPTLLGLKDNRATYDVTTPDRVWAYWNVMTHRMPPAEVLARFAEICRTGAEQLVERLRDRARALGAEPALPAHIPILSFADLRAEVSATEPEGESRFAGHARDVGRRGLDLPEQCRILTEHLWDMSRRSGPAVVIGFASMPYPATELRGEAGERLEAAVREAAGDVASRFATSIGIKRFFPGISDMSHLGQVDRLALPAVIANTPAWGFGIPALSGDPGCGVPIVNAGPWGRDYHTPLERLHAGYAFEVLPELLLQIMRRVLRTDQPYP